MCSDDVVELRLAIWGDETDGKFLGGISILGSSNMAYGNTDYSLSAYPFANTENLPVVVSPTRGASRFGKGRRAVLRGVSNKLSLSPLLDCLISVA